MAEPTTSSRPTLFPFLRYQDAAAAIDWLERAFGFRRGLVAPGPEGTIAHAELHLGPSVFMLGTAKKDALGLVSPREAGGVTQGIYVHVDDPDAHYRRAKDAGAEILMELTDQDYGSREYLARDPEGHLWSFGTYLPPAEPAA
jgi:uncharacterized glyoxalase superfamily protein PhnB